jgi:antitoxin MazE
VSAYRIEVDGAAPLYKLSAFQIDEWLRNWYPHCRYIRYVRISMKTKIQQWGNSLAIRVPAAFAKQALIERGSEVDVLLENGHLVVKPIKTRHKYSLAELLEGVTADQAHDEVDWGKPVGNEEW